MNTTFANGTFGEKRRLFSPTATSIINAIYVSTSIAVIVCNMLVVVLFCKDKQMRKPFHILLLNISLTDLFSAVAIQPYVWIDFDDIPLPGHAPLLCAISVGLMLLLACSITNILTLSAVTVLRYLGVVKEYQGHLFKSKRCCIAFCLLAWLTSILTRIPGALSFSYNHKEGICYRDWPRHINGRWYSILTTFFFLMAPFLLMAGTYALLVQHIWKRSRVTNGSNQIALRARRGVAVLLGLLLLTNVVCWFPFSMVWIMGRAFHYFANGIEGEYERQRWLRIAMIFALFNSVLDPFVYVFSSSEYRDRLLKLTS